MFGLMRAKKCGMSDEEKHSRRLNYCGTCKTIGSLYSQRSRLLLNHDTVFLAEFLNSLSGEDVGQWEKAYQSFNCLNLPEEEMPPALEFAATANVILSGFKLADHIADEGKSRYKFAYKWFSADFEKAEKFLLARRFPLEEVRAILQTQERRESETGENERFPDSVAEPTAAATAVFFREGARIVGRGDVAETAYKIGFAFGKLIYLIDAFEDFAKDFRAGQFNAVRAAFDLREAKMSDAARRKTVALARALETEIAALIRSLPIGVDRQTLFVSRLETNLHRKFKTHLPVVAAKKVCTPRAADSFSHRWRSAKETARELAREFSWQMPLVFAFVFVFALAAPAQTKEARSARECFDLGFNLMFLGAIFGAALAFPKTILMQANAEGKKKKKSKEDGWCDWCDCSGCHCGSCDGCDGCCDGCDCCCCCGDGCCCDGCSCD